jgi:hypothetical protein
MKQNRSQAPGDGKPEDDAQLDHLGGRGAASSFHDTMIVAGCPALLRVLSQQ